MSGRARRLPRPTAATWPAKAAWAFLGAILLCALGVGVALVRAEEESASARFTPASRGGRSAPIARSAVADLVGAYFPATEVARALRVLACESHYDPWATGARGEQGYFQLQPAVWGALARALFGPAADLYDPVINVGIGAAIWRSHGWTPWGCRP